MVCLSLNNSILAQTNAPELVKFQILVETTEDGIRLTGLDGCAWKELSFSVPKHKPQAIDQNGMTTKKGKSQVEENYLPHFLFTLTKTDKGLSFEGLKGTAWESLGFSCDGSCYQLIDQYGMVTAK